MKCSTCPGKLVDTNTSGILECEIIYSPVVSKEMDLLKNVG